ncbi:MAG TPA: hemolysin family protein, partial [Mycobacteriales bacterium]|nr:hemolysin family protein [Mycobacteriales bacterium]
MVWLLTRFTSWLTRALRLPERKLVTREDLELMLKGPATAKAGGEITEGERKMISRIFEFTDTTVHDVMVPLSDVVALSEDTDLDVASREVEDKQYTRFPVYKERIDRIVGTVHAFDVLKAGKAHSKVGLIARAPIFVPTSQPAVDLLVELQRARQGMAIVVDEYGGAVGIATIEDILEEIVGEITDEYDVERPPVEWLDTDTARVTSRLSVQDLAGLFDVALPNGEVETVAGLLAHLLGRVPIPGAEVEVGGLRLVAESATGRRNRIDSVLVSRLARLRRAGRDDGTEEEPNGDGS